jgi:hypothetical protein
MRTGDAVEVPRNASVDGGYRPYDGERQHLRFAVACGGRRRTLTPDAVVRSHMNHPLPDDIVTDVADEHAVAPEEVEACLDDLQRSLEREDGEYEYSTRHNFGWQDGDAYYFYGSEHLWTTLREELPRDEDTVDAAREAHRRAMLRSAEARDEAENVREMLADGNEPLVAANPDGDKLGFGLEV